MLRQLRAKQLLAILTARLVPLLFGSVSVAAQGCPVSADRVRSDSDCSLKEHAEIALLEYLVAGSDGFSRFSLHNNEQPTQLPQIRETLSIVGRKEYDHEPPDRLLCSR